MWLFEMETINAFLDPNREGATIFFSAHLSLVGKHEWKDVKKVYAVVSAVYLLFEPNILLPFSDMHAGNITSQTSFLDLACRTIEETKRKGCGGVESVPLGEARSFI